MLRISQVPAYLEANYGVTRDARTIYMWTHKGLKVGGKVVKLKSGKDNLGQVFTRKEWVDRFIERVND